MNKFLIGALLWGTVILLLTLTPGKSMPQVGFFSYDKLGHAGIFCIFSFLLITGMYVNKKSDLFKVSMWGVALATIYGLLIEFIQHFIPDRGMEWLDAIANMSGAILGFCLFYLWYKKFQSAKS